MKVNILSCINTEYVVAKQVELKIKKRGVLHCIVEKLEQQLKVPCCFVTK